MLPDIHSCIGAIWGVVGLVWLTAALNVKRTVSTQPASSRIIQAIIVCLGFVLVFSRAFDFSYLNARLLPPIPALAYAGLTATVAGAGLALWARFFIGRNWSSDVTIKQDHQLIRTGPYRMVRHPIYSGLLLGLLGTAIATNEVRAYIGVLVAAIGLQFKAAVEERLMTQQFGKDYMQYRQQTKAIIPFVF